MKTTTKGSAGSKSKTSAREELHKLTRNWTVRQLAALLRCHYTHASNILIGKRAPSLTLLRRLSKVVSRPMQELDGLLTQVQQERIQTLSRLHQARKNYPRS